MRGSLWDNRTGTSYTLDFENKRATFHAKETPILPDTGTSTKGTENLPEEIVEGVRCKVEPTEILDPAKGQKENGTPAGKTWLSTDYGLEVKQDITYASRDGKTLVHSIFELYDIHIGEEPDRNLFDLDRNFQVLMPQSQN